MKKKVEKKKEKEKRDIHNGTYIMTSAIFNYI